LWKKKDILHLPFMYKFDQFILLLQIELQVEAWCADKTAEALRCQKLLEEEEEAAQKRLATMSAL